MTKKKKIIISVISIIVIIGTLVLLKSCVFNNKLSLKIDDTTVETTKKGKAYIRGHVKGNGVLYVGSKKAVAAKRKNGEFIIKYELDYKNYYSEYIEIRYVDPKDSKNKVSKEVNVQFNKKEMKRLMRIEADKKAKKEKEEADRKREEEKRAAEELRKEEASKVPVGYTFNVAGDVNNEGKHIITKEEAGTYTTTCLSIVDRNSLDVQDYTTFVTIFPYDGNFDTGMDADQATYDYQLTIPEYAGLIKGFDGVVQSTKESIYLSEGNQINVLSGNVQFKKTQ